MAFDKKKLKGKLDDYEKRQEDLDNKLARPSVVRLRPGRTELALLPSYNEEDIYFEYAYHYNLGPKGEGQGRCCDDDDSVGDTCPGCKRYFKLMERGEKEKASNIRRVKRYIFNVVPISFKGPKSKTAKPYSDEDLDEAIVPMVLICGPKIWQQVCEILLNTSHDVTSIANGKNIVIKRTGTGRTDTEYVVTLADKERKLPLSARKALKESGNVFNLEEWTKERTAEELLAIMRGEDPTKTKKEKEDIVDEDELEDDDGEEDEEDADETPDDSDADDDIDDLDDDDEDGNEEEDEEDLDELEKDLRSRSKKK